MTGSNGTVNKLLLAVTTFLMGVVGTGLYHFVVLSPHIATMEDVEVLIDSKMAAHRCAWSADKGLVMNNILRLQKDVEELQDDVKLLNSSRE